MAKIKNPFLSTDVDRNETLEEKKARLLSESKEYMKNLILSSYLPERYKNDSEFEVFIILLAEVVGEVFYYINTLPTLVDPDECEDRFLLYLANNIGYNPPQGLTPDNIRLLIKYYLSMRKRRGTISSLKNAVRFSGRDELVLLSQGAGVDVDIKEFRRDGLFLIESSNVDYETIVKVLEKVRPAGVKWTYDIKYFIPSVKRMDRVTAGKIIEFNNKQEIINISLNEESEKKIMKIPLYGRMKYGVGPYGNLKLR